MDQERGDVQLRPEEQVRIRREFPEGVPSAGEDPAEEGGSPAARHEDRWGCLGRGQSDR